ncbi:MAG: hypothetical protein Q4F34_04485 [Prevotellaceae bacterium]|nr:hypothetical protein [Prevotellaceae bacterium]
MKKHFIWLVAAIVLMSCEGQNQPKLSSDSRADSLENVIAQKDNEINDMMGTLNEIQDGFRIINEAEDRVTLANTGEGADRKALIRENIEYIQDKMQQNRQLINKLQQQIRESSYKSEQLKRTVTSLLAQLADKDEQLKALREQLESKDMQIRELDDAVDRISEDLTYVSEESSNKSKTIAQNNTTIAQQDKQLNTAYFVFGTKKELTDQKILDGGKLSFSNFNRDYFTKIDIRVDTEIKLYSKSAKILSHHPSDAYTLTTDAKKQYVLRIINPDSFWSTSKYLVIVVK